MEQTLPFMDKFNAFVGMIVAVLSYVLGEHWFLFVGLLALNVGDYITGWMKSRKNKTLSSEKGTDGIIKKFGYWMMVAVAFGMSAIFIEVGEFIDVDLRITTMIGWFVLASLIINEFRSIIENFVEMGLKVPGILTEGLKVADKAVESAENALHMDLDGDNIIGSGDQNGSMDDRSE